MFEFLQFSVSDFLEQLHEALSPEWFHSVHCGFNLEDEQIAQSVHEASEFFNMSDPAIIKEDWTTGVMTNSPATPDDDVLVFNRAQMASMGITDKMGFDLVMTHEAAHRALDGLDVNFNSHQEELCCDFMAGVRAGLNGLDESKMERSLGGTQESLSHPWGVDRVIAIEKGVAYAQKFMNDNDGNAPSFSNCIAEFQNSNICEHASHDLSSITDPSTLQGVQDVDWLKHQIRISSGSERAHWAEELDWAQRHCFVGENPYASGFDSDHPMFSFEQLRNAGFSNHVANEILYGDNHCYSPKELFEVLYSKHPLESYNRMMDEKANEILEKCDKLEKEIGEEFGVYAFSSDDDLHEFAGHRGQYGNATGDYIDDSHPVDNDGWGSFHGLHVEDRAWNLKRADEYHQKELRELHEAKLDSDAGRTREAAEHARLAASYHRSMEEYKHAASICNK